MMRKKLNIALVAVLLILPGAAWTADGEEIIKYRISVMESYAGHTGAASRIVRGKVDFNDHLMMHVTTMRDTSLLLESLFPEDSDFGDTRAKDEVWSKRDDFNAAIKKNQEAAEVLFNVVQSGDSAGQAEAFKALTDSCKSCHDKFRAEEEE